MAYEKLYNEIYAIVALKYLWRGYRPGYVKSESPDWLNPEQSVGIEVSQALLPYDGQDASFLDSWLGRLSGEIPPEDKARYAGRLYFYNDRLWALLPDPRDTRDYAEKSLYRFRHKLEKLNKNFTVCGTNALYLYAHTTPEDKAGLRRLMADMNRSQLGHAKKFDLVFLDCESCIYIFDFNSGGMAEMPVGEKAKAFLEQQTERIRNGNIPEDF
ncbi:MAG: hypothetical protein PUB32_03505 [Clostridiales bacterium]|nr:hypothetical protein [Clostridiales bacterium]